MKEVSTIFLGAGTAALAAGNRMLESGDKGFLILEKGNSLDKRFCPGAKEYTCKFCKRGCYMVEGVGGANALYGNKICYFPASERILEDCTLDEKDIALKYLNSFQPYIDSGNIQETENKIGPYKEYTSDVLDQNEYRLLINALSKKLVENELILANTNIIKISKKKNGKFSLLSQDGAVFICSKLILATGRSSHLFLKDLFDSLSIEYSFLNQDIGIRIETSKENFSKNYYYQVDPKIKFDFGDLGSGRTFCAHNQGLVVPIQFGNSFFADGAFSDKFSDNNNIALMVRTKNPLDNTLLEKWCGTINQYTQNSLILNKIDLFNKPTQQLVNEIFSSLPIYPSETHKMLMRNLLVNLFSNEEFKILNSHLLGQTLTIYGPAIDRYWVAPVLDRNFASTTVRNCYVIGDAIGKSRGIFQAMFSGVLWANRYLKTEVKENNHDKVRSSGLSTSVSS